MPRKSPTTERRQRLTVELAVCGLGPHAIAKRTGQAESRVRRVLKGVGLFRDGDRAPPHPP
jgi:hypothetical protein